MTATIDPQYADYKLLPTPKGMFRFKEIYRSNLESAYLMIVALEEDGGITLNNGLTYFTTKNRCMRWHSARNVRLENKTGSSLPLRPRKESGRGFGSYIETFSIEAQEVHDLIFGEYIANRLPGVPPYDVNFEFRVHEARRSYLERVRQLKVEAEKVRAATKAEFDALDEEYLNNYVNKNAVGYDYSTPFHYSDANYARIAFDE